MPKEMTGAERRKANKIAFLMEDLQISYEEAEEKYKEIFRILARKGGSKTGATKLRGGSEYYSTIGKIGGKKKAKNSVPPN